MPRISKNISKTPVAMSQKKPLLAGAAGQTRAELSQKKTVMQKHHLFTEQKVKAKILGFMQGAICKAQADLKHSALGDGPSPCKEFIKTLAEQKAENIIREAEKNSASSKKSSPSSKNTGLLLFYFALITILLPSQTSARSLPKDVQDRLELQARKQGMSLPSHFIDDMNEAYKRADQDITEYFSEKLKDPDLKINLHNDESFYRLQNVDQGEIGMLAIPLQEGAVEAVDIEHEAKHFDQPDILAIGDQMMSEKAVKEEFEEIGEVIDLMLDERKIKKIITKMDEKDILKFLQKSKIYLTKTKIRSEDSSEAAYYDLDEIELLDKPATALTTVVYDIARELQDYKDQFPESMENIEAMKEAGLPKNGLRLQYLKTELYPKITERLDVEFFHKLSQLEPKFDWLYKRLKLEDKGFDKRVKASKNKRSVKKGPLPVRGEQSF